MWISSIIGIIYFAVIHFWILLGISIASLILCIVVATYSFTKYVLDAYANYGSANRDYNDNNLGNENHKEND